MLDTGQLALSSKALALFRQGLDAASANDYEHAIACFNQILELETGCYQVWYERGLALERRGDYVEAIASYDRALSLQPTSDAACEIWHDRGNSLHYGLGDYNQALACYDQAIRLYSNHDQVWQNRANALLYGLSLPEEALAAYDRALAINPENLRAWRNRGNALAELRRYDEAIKSYDRALTLSPNDQVAWHARNLAAEKAGFGELQPPTNPLWYGSGFNEQTFVEGDTDSDIIFASKFTAAREIIEIEKGQPLLVIEDDWGRREILLERDQYILGRDPNSDICLHSQFVSRCHATISKVTDSDGCSIYQIEDGSPSGKPSTNGLLINGRRSPRASLNTEDVIVFGPKVRAVYRLVPASRIGI